MKLFSKTHAKYQKFIKCQVNQGCFLLGNSSCMHAYCFTLNVWLTGSVVSQTVSFGVHGCQNRFANCEKCSLKTSLKELKTFLSGKLNPLYQNYQFTGCVYLECNWVFIWKTMLQFIPSLTEASFLHFQSDIVALLGISH